MEIDRWRWWGGRVERRGIGRGPIGFGLCRGGDRRQRSGNRRDVFIRRSVGGLAADGESEQQREQGKAQGHEVLGGIGGGTRAARRSSPRQAAIAGGSSPSSIGSADARFIGLL